MSISVTWATKVINIPRADMTLVQTSPTEIRTLDLNQFHLTLRALEQSEAGMLYPSTHLHNTQVTVGGVTLARVIQMINDYTITFEDGQYAVNLSGANSDASDRVNVNQVSVRSANSAGLVNVKEISEATQTTKRLIENLRPHHTGTGDVFYWNPVNGSDLNDGLSANAACLTFAHIHDNLVTDYGHDIIMACTSSAGVGITTAAEAVTISKNYVFLRGPGRDFEIDTSSIGGAGVYITGKGVELAGVRIKTGTGGTDPALSIAADFALIKSVWIESCGGDAVNITTSTNTIIEGGYFKAYKGHGINVGNSVNHLWLRDLGLHGTSGNGDGVHINGTSVYEVKVTGHCDIHGNTGYGVNILSSSSRINLGSDVAIDSNTAGDVNDPYAKMVYDGRVHVERMVVPKIGTVGGGSGVTAAEVWAYTNRALTVAPSSITPADVWGYATRALTVAPSSLTAAEVWSHGSRALTVAPSSLTAAEVRAELAPELAKLDATVSSRSTVTPIQIWTFGTRELTLGLTASDVWTYGTRGLTTASTSITTAQIRTELAPELARMDVAMSSRSSHSAVDVWGYVNRSLSIAPSTLTAAQVWAYGTKTLSTTPSSLTAADVWAYNTRSLNVGGVELTAADVWGYASRSLTSTAAGLTAAQVRTELAPELARLDATVSSRSTLNAQQVWEYSVRPVTNMVMPADTWTYVTRGLTTAFPTIPSSFEIAGAVRVNLATELGRIDVASSSRYGGTPPTTAAIATQVRTELGTELARIDSTVSSRATNSGVWASPDKVVTNAVISSITASQIASAVRFELEGELTKIDASISSRMPFGDYSPPPTAAQNAIATRVYLADELARIDASVSSRVSTDAVIDANVIQVKGKPLIGDGTPNNPWTAP